MKTLDSKADILHAQIEKILHMVDTLHNCCINTMQENLSLHELKTLYLLGKTGPKIMREISDHLLLKVSTLTPIINRMVKNGLVKRERSEEDLRIIRIHITEKGNDTFKHGHETIISFSALMLQTLTEKEQTVFLDLLQKISRGLPDDISCCI